MCSNYIKWHYLQDYWMQQYGQHDRRVAKAVAGFFNPDIMFPVEKTRSIQFYIGKDEAIHTSHLLIATDTCRLLQETLTDLLSQVDPNLPPPRTPHLSSATYVELEQHQVTSKKQLSKLNEKIKRATQRAERLAAAKKEWQYAARLASQQKYVFCSVDIEVWEQDHSILLEIGWSLFDSKTNRFMDQHYIIDSYQHLVNGRFVEDEKLHFQFGASVWTSVKSALEEFRKDLDWCVERDGGFVLVGHDLSSDLAYLKKQKFEWPGGTVDAQKSMTKAIFSTETIYAASIGNLHNPPSLGSTLAQLGIETWHLHNAGNDAHYTLLLFLELVKRWDNHEPNRTLASS